MGLGPAMPSPPAIVYGRIAYTRNHVRPCRGPCPRFHRQQLSVVLRHPLCCIPRRGHVYTSIPGGNAHAGGGNHCLLPRASRLVHLQEGVLPMPPLQEGAPPVSSQATVASHRALPACSLPRRSHTYASTLVGGHAHIFSGNHSLLLRLFSSPGGGHAHVSFPGRGFSSSLGGTMPTLPQATVACCRAPPVCFITRRDIPTPPLQQRAMPKPRLQEGPCPLLHHQPLPTAARLRVVALQEGVMPSLTYYKDSRLVESMSVSLQLHYNTNSQVDPYLSVALEDLCERAGSHSTCN